MPYHMTIKYAIKLVERRAEYLRKRIEDRTSRGLVCDYEKAEHQAIHKLIRHIAVLEANYASPSKRTPAELDPEIAPFFKPPPWGPPSDEEKAEILREVNGDDW